MIQIFINTGNATANNAAFQDGNLEAEKDAFPSPSTEFLDAAKVLIESNNSFKQGQINPVEHSRARETALSKAVVAMASDMGVKLKLPLQINSRGEFNIISMPKDGSSPEYGAGPYGQDFSDALNRHNPRTGVSSGALLLPDSGWSFLNHFDAETMVMEYAGPALSLQVNPDDRLEQIKRQASVSAKIAGEHGIDVDAQEIEAVLVRGAGSDRGVFEGNILAVDEKTGVAFQSKGRGDVRVLLVSSLSRIPEVGEHVKITFKDGKGQVADQEQNNGKNVGR